jgi:Skp family chaperone for outer membrane proteins
MKPHLVICLLSFVLSAASASAADPVIVVNSPSSITIDGAESGKVADCIANHPQLASAIQRALEKWHASREAALAKLERDAEIKSTAALETIKEMKHAEEKTGKGKRWEALDELQAALNVTADDVAVKRLDEQIASLKREREKIRPQ